jgi:hypothetical protein
VKRLGGVIRPEVSAVSENGPVVHQVALTEQFLPGLDVRRGEQNGPVRRKDPIRQRRSRLVHKESTDQHDGEAKEKGYEKAVLPKPRPAGMIRFHGDVERPKLLGPRDRHGAGFLAASPSRGSAGRCPFWRF